jgi:hypothetical protein
MAVMKEWCCIEHGEFEGTHPICPGNGCDSRFVTQEFRTPVGITSDYRKRFDAGIRKSADMYKIDDFRSAKAGESSFEGRAPAGAPQVLWGDESKKVLGKSFAELTQVAQKPFIARARDGRELRIDRNNAMREVATDAHITARRVPQAHEVTAARSEKGAKERATALAT